MFYSFLIVLPLSLIFCCGVGIDAGCYETEEIVTGLYNPLAVDYIDDGRRWMLIAEHRGVIRSVDASSSMSIKQSRLNTFLDITDRVLTSARQMDERGLLGFTLDPRFIDNHHFYVFYSIATTPSNQHLYDHDSLISRFRAKKVSGLWQAVKESEVMIIRINQPNERQNGGQLFFAPNDEHLYITTGDGGDHYNARFKKNSLLGKILRIDVRNSTNNRRYSIPHDNPFVNDTFASPEVYAYGFRNPWRCTVDYESADRGITTPSAARIFCGDLGEPGRNVEDLNIVKAGGRYGWLDDPNAGCHTLHECLNHCDKIRPGDYLPIHIYEHDEGQAIIGGIFYRGAAFPRLENHYIYGDYVHGTFHTLVQDASGNWQVQELCVKYGTEAESRRRHILGISKMEPDHIIILTNTLMRNNESTGSIFKLKPEETKFEANTSKGYESISMTKYAIVVLLICLLSPIDGE